MNIAQELSIVRDNIAEYGMTNITQLEYDAIYEQGRADAIDEYNRELKAYLRRFGIHYVSDSDFDYIAEKMKEQNSNKLDK